jgi:hypothetical protein
MLMLLGCQSYIQLHPQQRSQLSQLLLLMGACLGYALRPTMPRVRIAHINNAYRQSHQDQHSKRVPLSAG